MIPLSSCGSASPESEEAFFLRFFRLGLALGWSLRSASDLVFALCLSNTCFNILRRSSLSGSIFSVPVKS